MVILYSSNFIPEDSYDIFSPSISTDDLSIEEQDIIVSLCRNSWLIRSPPA